LSAGVFDAPRAGFSKPALNHSRDLRRYSPIVSAPGMNTGAYHEKDAPKGRESKIYLNIGEEVSDEINNILKSYTAPPKVVINNGFDGGRNLEVLVKYLGDPGSYGVVSGRKPSGPCHFGHKLVVETLSFFQENGGWIFLPVADLEVILDPKIDKEEHYFLLAADNLLDWGAWGLNLDAAYVYPQSEEIRVMNLAYLLSRNLNFENYLDIYGADTMINEFQFIFAGLTQVGDILLPQHSEFGKETSFMLSGPDQDGHMKMTTDLSGYAVESGIIKSLPSSLYIPLIPSFEGKKESSSGPGATLYLGSLRNEYAFLENGGKQLDNIRKLSLDERIKESMYKIDKYCEINKPGVESSICKRAEFLDCFSDLDLADDNLITTFKARVASNLKDQYERRKQVLEYALYLTGEYLEKKGELAKKEELKTVAMTKKLNLYNSSIPAFWKKESASYIPENLRTAQTPWYLLVSRAIAQLQP